MASIYLEMLVGPDAGKRVLFNADQITFGRGQDNTLLVPVETASRQQGRIYFEAGQWWLENLSPNGTRVNRRKITSNARELRNGDVIGVGDQAAFRLHIPRADTLATGPAEDEVQVAGPPLKAGLSSRAKIWIGIGVYAVSILIIGIVLSSVMGDRNSTAGHAPRLSERQIRQEITQPRTVPQTNPLLADQRLQEANEQYNLIDALPDALYRSHRAFQEALAWSGRDHFENPEHTLRFHDVQEKLLNQITWLYSTAYERLISGQWQEADKLFERLTKVYPDRQSLIYKNAEQHRATLVPKKSRRTLL